MKKVVISFEYDPDLEDGFSLQQIMEAASGLLYKADADDVIISQHITIQEKYGPCRIGTVRVTGPAKRIPSPDDDDIPF